MMTTIKKFKIHPLTYFFILSACLTGYFKLVFILLLIIVFHELGHVLTICLFKYPVKKVEFYPFGGMTKIEKDINSSIKKEIIIAISGIFFQVILGFIAIFLHQFNIIDTNFYIAFKTYNIIILLFNLLPLVPLDGHIILKSFLEMHFSFKNSYFISVAIAVSTLIIFFIINQLYHLDNYIIISFLVYKLIESINKFKFIQNRFLLERFLKDYNYSKVKIILGQNFNSMAKEKKHLFLKGNKLFKERDALAKLFDNKS